MDLLNRNMELRERYNEVSKEFDLKHTWVCQVVEMPYSTFSSWKVGNTLISREKLDAIENLMDKYNNFWA